MMKRNVLNALFLSNLLAFTPVSSFAGECTCNEECQAACAEGKGDACTCKECQCKEGHCKHGKCKTGKKLRKE